MTTAVCTYDFTIGKDFISKDEIVKLMELHCKKWCFQLEEGETGYEHYQGRISLKVKVRLTGLIKLIGKKEFHFSITSNENRDNDFYACKEDTRKDGPWKDSDEKVYIPRQVREITELYPWQQYIVDHYNIWDTRTINVIIDNKGNTGKSTLVSYMRAYKLAFKIPFCNDFRDVLRMVCDVPIKRCYLIDMPRAIKKDKLYQLFGAIEEIKNGYAYDDRYHFKEVVFDCPNIWCFMNMEPDISMLSADRWRFWEINNSMELTPYDKSEFEGASL